MTATPLPPKRFSWWRRWSVFTKALILALLAGGVGWVGMVVLLERNVRDVQHEQHLRTLRKHAATEHARFQSYLSEQLLFLKRLVLMESFRHYVMAAIPVWQGKPPLPEVLAAFPPWLPPRHLIAHQLRTEPFLLLLDDQARIRESYQEFGESPPAGLQEKLFLYSQNLQNEAIVTVGERPYFLVSIAVTGEDGATRAILANVIPLADAMLMSLHGDELESDIIAMIDDNEAQPTILGSSQPDLVRAGTPLARYRDSFFVISKELLGSGFTSEMLPQTVVLFPREETERYVDEVLGASRFSGVIIVLVQILAMIPLLLWLDGRLGQVTAKIREYLTKQRFTLLEGSMHADEIDVLMDLFDHFLAQIDNANTAIKHELEKRTRAEEEARDNEGRLAILVERLPLLLVEVDRKGLVTRWNQAARAILELDAADCLGRGLATLPLAWDRDALARGIRRTLQNRTGATLERFPFSGRLSGVEKVLELRLFPATREDARLLILGADITERVRLEAGLAHSRKMEAVGTLAAGIAHEINTPIQFVGDNVHFLGESFADLQRLLAACRARLRVTEGEDDAIRRLEGEVDPDYLQEEIPKAIGEIQNGVERVGIIVRAMKDFSHPDSGEMAPCDVNAALNDTLIIARNEIKYVARLESDLEPGLPTVPCHRNEMNQVYLNLLINAAHAIRDKPGRAPEEMGTIRVETRRQGSEIVIRIGDTGCGIPPAIRDRVFEPFFTTKEVGRGTGQGLAIAHNVVTRRHGGSLSFTSREGIGTTFEIRLPLEVPLPPEVSS